MMSRFVKFWLIPLLIVVIFLVFLVLKWGPKIIQSPVSISSDLKSQTGLNPTCIYPVVMSSPSFEPTIPEGTKLMMNKCFEDKNNLPEKTMVLFKQNDGLKLRMIVGKKELQDGVFYQVVRSLDKSGEETINAKEILAVWDQK